MTRLQALHVLCKLSCQASTHPMLKVRGTTTGCFLNGYYGNLDELVVCVFTAPGRLGEAGEVTWRGGGRGVRQPEPGLREGVGPQVRQSGRFMLRL